MKNAPRTFRFDGYEGVKDASLEAGAGESETGGATYMVAAEKGVPRRSMLGGLCHLWEGGPSVGWCRAGGVGTRE
ncbi:hypothetical protein GCM10020001_067980 [Nonomuraea salmonea]